MPRKDPAIPDTSERHAEVRAAARVHFDKWAQGYDRSRLNELIFFPTIRLCLEEISRWQELRGGGPFDMIDVGCGTGTLLTHLARQSEPRRLVGLDFSPVMIERLDAKIAEQNLAPRLSALQGDAEHLPFDDGAFDILTCCNSFHHYPHQAAAVREFHRVLRPDGLLLLIDGFRDNVIGWLVFDVGVATVEKDVHHASWTELREMIQAAGFQTLRQRKMNVFTPVLANIAHR